jgi:hypothetical protein
VLWWCADADGTQTGEEGYCSLAACSLGLSATSQQYFSLRTNQPPATSQQYFSLSTNQHQPPTTSQTNRLWEWEMRKGPLSTPRAESRDERALKGGFHDVEEKSQIYLVQAEFDCKGEKKR